ncbi:MAG: serine/threonine protein kinase, partial [Gemmatimonadaceae bacterium]
MSSKVCPQCGRVYDVTQKFCPEDGAVLRRNTLTSDLVGTIVADRYHVIKKLGEGGMGMVYLAEHVRMGRKSALKVMSPQMMSDPDAISRFNREAANACQINHPHIAAVYDFGETPDGVIFLAMEFVDGESLSALIQRHHALPAHRAAEITRQVGDALTAAHELGIVHRDLKPDNIMITRSRDGADVVKVVDFGIAKASRGGDNQKVTRTGWIVGTPEYMSPEQLAGDPVDARSDIYSLGLVAFNTFTGQLPFPAKTSKEAMIARLTERPRTLAEMKGDTPWPAELQAVMDRALARDAEDRYFSAREFGRDVVAALAALPNLPVGALGATAQESRELQRMMNSGAKPVSGARPGQLVNTMAAAPSPLGATSAVPQGR